MSACAKYRFCVCGAVYSSKMSQLHMSGFHFGYFALLSHSSSGTSSGSSSRPSSTSSTPTLSISCSSRHLNSKPSSPSTNSSEFKTVSHARTDSEIILSACVVYAYRTDKLDMQAYFFDYLHVNDVIAALFRLYYRLATSRR